MRGILVALALASLAGCSTPPACSPETFPQGGGPYLEARRAEDGRCRSSDPPCHVLAATMAAGHEPLATFGMHWSFETADGMQAVLYVDGAGRVEPGCAAHFVVVVRGHGADGVLHYHGEEELSAPVRGFNGEGSREEGSVEEGSVEEGSVEGKPGTPDPTAANRPMGPADTVVWLPV